jgi:putative ABC transport system permease protein
VIALLTLEGTLLGVVGGLLGIALGVGLSKSLLTATSRALSQAYLQLAATEVKIDPPVLVLGFTLGVIAAAIASWLPARRAVSDPPVLLLRAGGLMQTQPLSLRPSRSDALALLLIALAWPLLYLPVVASLPFGAFLSAFALLGAGSLLMPRLVQLIAAVFERADRGRLPLEAQLAHQNLPRDIARTATTAGALMAGVSLAISFATFTNSFATTIDEWVEQTLPGDIFITQSASIGGTSMRNVPMADTLREGLAAMPEVEDVRRVRIVEMPYRGMPIKVVSSELDIFIRHAHLNVLEGGLDSVLSGLRKGAVSVSENFARRFAVHRGDTIELSAQGGTRKFEVAGVHVDYTSDVGSVLFERAIYTEVFGDSRVDTYELYLKPGSDAQLIQRRVNERYGVDRDLFVLTNSEFRAEVSTTTEQVFTLVRALEIVALLVAVLGIVNAQLANVLDRVREIGVLRALGMLRRQTSRMVVIEAALVGGIGTLAGVLVGLALGYILLSHINLVQTGWYFPYRVSLRAILEVSVLTLPAAALAGFYPARHAAKLVITDALEYE